MKGRMGKSVIFYLRKAVDGLYLVSAVVLVLIGVYSLVRQSVFAGVVLPVLTAVVIRVSGRRKGVSGERRYHIWWTGVQLLSLGLMLVTVFALDVDLTWDWGRLIHTASEYAITGKIDRPDYFAMYPNNRFWEVCLMGLFRLVRLVAPGVSIGDFKVISTIFSVLLVQAALFFLYRTACLLWGEGWGFVCGCVATGCAPLYVYAMFAYSDTSGMLLVSVFVYLCVKFYKGGCRRHAPVLLGFLSAVILETKVMAFIVCIAAVMAVFLCWSEGWRRYAVYMGLALLTCIVSCLAIDQGVERVIPVTEELSDAYRLPPEHWIMMGLAGDGGYNQEDVDYMASFSSYEERKRAAESEMLRRCRAYRVTGMLRHMAAKIQRTWGCGALNSQSYCNRKPFRREGVLFAVFSEAGRYHWISLAYTGIYHGMLLLGLLLSGILAWKRSPGFLLLGRICTLGIFLFLLMWECNSRYLLVFYPVLLLTAADGWIELVRRGKFSIFSCK